MKIEILKRTSGNFSTGRLKFHTSILKFAPLRQKQARLCQVSEAYDIDIKPRMRRISGISFHQLTEIRLFLTLQPKRNPHNDNTFKDQSLPSPRKWGWCTLPPILHKKIPKLSFPKQA